LPTDWGKFEGTGPHLELKPKIPSSSQRLGCLGVSGRPVLDARGSLEIWEIFQA